ncbi:MAG: 2-hydroxyacyl-CoA dehydratase family protein [Thermoguttaceae bacterium]|jgi:benzoyl-CoA reductase/2-hydroxyglutaryl-CoA dehydratase subunit BcrC/BadD/HgdB
MKTISYVSPFVPVEWIEAHGLRACRATLAGERGTGAVRGVCPYARAFVQAALDGAEVGGVVMTTTCDQMRHAAALVERHSDRPLFLMNVPATWQSPAARTLYRDEIRRLGRFLVELGGRSPTPAELAAVMLRCDEDRAALRLEGPRLPGEKGTGTFCRNGPAGASHKRCLSPFPVPGGTPAPQGVRLALVGGPLLQGDEAIFEMVHRAGGRVVLDATEGGRRSLPAALDRTRTAQDPLESLVAAYFDTIPDAFRRPNDGLYQWLDRELAAQEVRGILFWRYVWCDLWHAELHRLRQWSRLPVLEINDGDAASPARVIGRIEAFLEVLR